MTPAPATPPRSSPLFVVSLIVGALLGLALGGGSSWALLRRRAFLAHRGWNLTPVVVAVHPIAPGTPVAMADVSQSAIPTTIGDLESIIKPDALSYVVNQPPLVPIAAGEPLRWAYFNAYEKPIHPLLDAAAIGACEREASARVKRTLETPDEIRARLRSGRSR